MLMQHIVPSHSTASDVKRPVSESFVFCFGDGSRGQLGSGDQNQRAHPQENFWVTRFLRKLKVQLSEVCWYLESSSAILSDISIVDYLWRLFYAGVSLI